MISIIIPAYNAERYINRCIKSILNQTFSDFELIVVDDGSTDNTFKLCAEYADTDNRLNIIHTDNFGVSHARNVGLDRCSGDFITFIDADDYIPQNYLQELYIAIKGSDISVCDISCVYGDAEGTRFSCNTKLLLKNEAIELLLSRKEINSGPNGKLFNKKIIGNTRFPIMQTYEDILFVLEVFDKCSLVSSTTKTQYIYYNNIDGAMANYSKHPNNDVVIMAQTVLAYLDKNKTHHSYLPEYTTISHLMQHLKQLSTVTEKTKEQQSLIDSIIIFFKQNKKRIINNKCFTIKEKVVYLSASKGYWIHGGISKI